MLQLVVFLEIPGTDVKIMDLLLPLFKLGLNVFGLVHEFVLHEKLQDLLLILQLFGTNEFIILSLRIGLDLVEKVLCHFVALILL